MIRALSRSVIEFRYDFDNIFYDLVTTANVTFSNSYRQGIVPSFYLWCNPVQNDDSINQCQSLTDADPFRIILWSINRRVRTEAMPDVGIWC